MDDQRLQPNSDRAAHRECRCCSLFEATHMMWYPKDWPGDQEMMAVLDLTYTVLVGDIPSSPPRQAASARLALAAPEQGRR